MKYTCLRETFEEKVYKKAFFFTTAWLTTS